MKAIKNIKLIVILALATLVLDACVQDDDFQTPVIEIEEPDVTVNYTLQEIKDAIEANNGEPFIIQAEASDPVYVEAYVVSDDEAGNIYQKIYVQDQPENPEVGIAISTFATDVYPIYAKGRKVYIRVDGLAAASSNGMPSIGADVDSQYGVTRIAQDKLRELVLISTTTAEIVPTEVSVSELLSEQYLGTYVKLNNVQFANPDQNYTSGNQTTNVTFEDCEGNSSYLRNSNYADFADTPLPNGKGSIQGIAAVYNSDYQLFINSVKDVDLNGDRCGSEDPGDGGENPDATIVEPPFNEDFEAETAGTGESVSIDGWTNVNANGGARVFEVREFDGNKYAQTSAFNSDENPYEAWLVMPGVDLSGSSSATLSFATKDGYYNGLALTTYISTDFDGDVNNATWTEITGVTYSSGNTGGYAENFVPSGDIDLSAYAGETVYVAFQYLGASDGVTSTYQIDDISLTAN